MNRLLLILVFSLFIISCREGNPVEELNGIEDEGIEVLPVISIALVPSTPDYYLKGYHAEGFYLELVKMMKNRHKTYVNYVTCKNVAEAMQLIKDDKCDIACVDNIINTGDHRDHIRFTQSIVNEKLILVQKRDNPTFIHTPKQLTNDTIFYAGNPTIEPYLDELAEKLNVNYIPISNDTVSDIELVKMLNDGKIKYAVVSSRYAKSLKGIFTSLDFSVPLSFETGRCWIYNNRNKVLKNELPDWIKNIDLKEKRKNNFVGAYLDKNKNISIYDDVIKKIARKNSSLNPYFVIALAYHESTFYDNLTSAKGAYGLLQLMPATLAKYGADTTATSFQQIEVGVKFLEELKSKYAQNIKNESDLYAFILAAYNSGSGRLDDAISLSKKSGFDKKLWWGNVEKGMKYIRRKELISPDSTDENFKGHHTYFFVRNVMESYTHFRNLR